MQQFIQKLGSISNFECILENLINKIVSGYLWNSETPEVVCYSAVILLNPTNDQFDLIWQIYKNSFHFLQQLTAHVMACAFFVHLSKRQGAGIRRDGLCRDRAALCAIAICESGHNSDDIPHHPEHIPVVYCSPGGSPPRRKVTPAVPPLSQILTLYIVDSVAHTETRVGYRVSKLQ